MCEGKVFILVQSQTAASSDILKCKQILKAKLAACQHDVTNQCTSGLFAFQYHFSINSRVLTQGWLRSDSLFQLRPPVDFADLQTNGNVIQTDAFFQWVLFRSLARQIESRSCLV
ncbi:hypothetical protein XENOCAPTIV_011573 [Xenoophorus captivus]|uniref:Uncharacterized protein n=1 Tax=Xenoophorus captivus TaxID=1517983 RepID=A0ABV0S3S0_9TELE